MINKETQERAAMSFAMSCLLIMHMLLLLFVFTPPIVGAWISISIAAGTAKYVRNECGTEYRVDNIFYTDIVCDLLKNK